jgi:hypothetical protein
MPTNAIGRGNTLIGVCVPEEVKAIFGREATAENRSIANYVLTAALEHLRSAKPAIAQQIEEARAEHIRAVRATACLVVGLLSIAAATVGGIDMRRASTRVRVPRPSASRRYEV